MKDHSGETGALKTTPVPSPVKLKLWNVAGVWGIPLKVPVPVRKFQLLAKVIEVRPPPLGPEAVAVPKNEAEPVMGTASTEKAVMARRAQTPKARKNLEILINIP